MGCDLVCCQKILTLASSLFLRMLFIQATAVAARSGDKAAKFAEEHNVKKSYGSYEELLADPEIDVVYVGSVADQHMKLATKSLLAGKPTLVEKPLTLTHKDSETLVQLAQKTDTFLM